MSLKQPIPSSFVTTYSAIIEKNPIHSPLESGLESPEDKTVFINRNPPHIMPHNTSNWCNFWSSFDTEQKYIIVFKCMYILF